MIIELRTYETLNPRLALLKTADEELLSIVVVHRRLRTDQKVSGRLPRSQ